LVSAQNRQRFYVTNFGDIEQPEDRGILLKDILETGQPRYEKSPCIDANYYKGGNLSRPECKSGQRLMTCEQVSVETDNMQPRYIGAVPENNGTYLNGKQPSQQYRIYDTDGKGVAVTTAAITNVAEPVGTTKDEKAYCLTSGYSNGSGEKIGNYAAHTLEKGCKSMVAEAVNPTVKAELYAIQTDEPMRVKEATKQGYVDISVGGCVDLTQPNSKTRRGRSLTNKSNCLTTSHSQYEYCGVLGYATPCEWDENGIPTKAVSCADGKTYTVYEVKDGQITIKGKQYPIKLLDGYYIIRKLTVTECARLQTMPDDYCKAVSDSQAYKALGNGWTAEVIIHLLNHALKDVPRDEEIIVLSMYDGIATGRYCLDKMGFTNVTYHAYEIDKYPIMVAMDNYPDIIQHGDAFAVREDDWQPPQTRSEWLDELLGGDL
jgi:site-specific DNA-cytosine methylase